MTRLLFLLLFLPIVTEGQIITTVAGSSLFSGLGDGGPATAAHIEPYGCVADKDGNLFITEYEAHRIRKVNTAGIITTIAGTGVGGYNGDGIPATEAQLDYPQDIAVDVNGNIYFADEGNKRVRRIDAATQIITTIAGNGELDCNYFINGATATSSCIGDIRGMCIDRAGNVFIANWAEVDKIDPSGIINVIAGTDGIGSGSFPFSTPVPAISASLSGIKDITVDNSDNLYIKLDYLPYRAQNGYAAIVRVDTAGVLSQYAGTGYDGYSGDGGMATDAKIEFVTSGLTTDTKGNLYFCTDDEVRKVDNAGIICTVAGNGTAGFSGDGSPATAAQLNFTTGITTDSSGNLFIVDYMSDRIRKVTQPSCGYIHTAGITATESNKRFSIYPNPVKTDLTINAPYPIFSISIINIVGQLVVCRQCNTSKVQVDVSALSAGVYLVRVNGLEVRRFVKQ